DLGSIWVGFNYDGLAIMNYRKSWFQHIRRDATGTLVDHTVRSVCVAGDGTTLFGVQRAVHRYDPHTDRLQSFVMPEHVVNGFNQVQAILYDKGQNYWIGTYGNGLNRLDAATGKFSKYDAYPSGVQQRILSLTRFGDFLWIGTPSEIIRIHPATSSSRIYKNIRAVNSFAQTNTQKLIAGSGTNGLFFYDAVADSFMPWLSSSMKYPSDYETRSLFADSQYIVWQGTSNGLNKINHKTGEITRYTRNDGIPSTDVTGIIQSPDQRLWISTTSGILRLDPGQSQFRYYYKENGLLGNEFSLSAVAMSSEGRIFFGGIQGVTWFNASDVRDYDYKPTLLITKISRFYQDVDGEIPYNSIEAQYNENVLTFEYSVLDYAFSAGIHYAYRLEGFNQTWIQTDERHATFTNLDPGEYVFRVRGTRGDGTWIDSESKVFITIHPPYWLTWWFWSLVVFCIGMVTWMGYRMRVRSLLRRKRELQTEVERQTKELYAKNIELQSLNDTKNEFLGMAAHDLRNPLGAVGNIAELMLFEMNPENPETKQTFSDLNRIIQLTERMSYLIHELLDYSAIESGKVSLAVDTIDWTVLVHEVCEMNERAASRKKIVIKKEFSDGTIVLHGDRMRLMSVLDNLVSNAIKYSFAGTEVLIRSEVANRKLRVTVYDHGQGLPEADVARAFKSFQKLSAKPTGGESSTGLGLAIIKKIIDLHAGQVWLESELHKGSTFGFSLPLERPFSD
ncbi:MAG TPA: ATP-binding protein, partial [bacterium]|nr:ATP-binding protein [bacterium]